MIQPEHISIIITAIKIFYPRMLVKRKILHHSNLVEVEAVIRANLSETLNIRYYTMPKKIKPHYMNGPYERQKFNLCNAKNNGIVLRWLNGLINY